MYMHIHNIYIYIYIYAYIYIYIYIYIGSLSPCGAQRICSKERGVKNTKEEKTETGGTLGRPKGIRRDAKGVQNTCSETEKPM